MIGPGGGKLDTLSFAIVGDTRPPGINDTAGYPSAVASKIWADVEAQSPRPNAPRDGSPGTIMTLRLPCP